MIKCITIDLDGVYYTNNGIKAFFDKLESLGADRADLVDYYYYSQLREDFQLGRISEKDYWKVISEKFDIEVVPEDLYEVIGKNTLIDKRLRNWLAYKKKLGFMLGICSNLFPFHVRARRLCGKEPEGFDFKVYSCEVGLKKPNKEIFELVVKKAEVAPSEILYIDDNPKRLTGAKRVGIRTLVYAGYDNFLNEFRKYKLA